MSGNDKPTRPTRSSERRKKEYRKLLDKAEILQEEEETGLETAKAIDNILKEANILFKESKLEDRVKHTDEVLLDAKLLATTSTVLLNVTDAIDAAIDSYEPSEFGKRIRRNYLYSNDEFQYSDLQWSNLFEFSRKLIKAPPEFAYMCGYSSTKNTSDEPPKKKKPKERKRADKQEQAAKKQPEKLATANQEEDSVDDTVKFLQWSLNKEYESNNEKPLNYFRFIINPHNFTNTIENMFHLSFLVRDGRVKLHRDENDMLVLSPVSSSESKKARRDELPYKQCIISIDTTLWKKAIKKLKISTCFLEKWKPKWEERKTKRH